MTDNEAMGKFRPIHGILIVVLFSGVVYGSNYLWHGRHEQSFERVAPDRNGQVLLDVGDLAKDEVRFYRFLNAANQEVRFFVGRDETGTVQVAFDANELCYKLKRGYRHEGEWVVCNKCDKSFRLAETNAGGGGCRPVPLDHRVEGDQLVLAESAILQGWRYFR